MRGGLGGLAKDTLSGKHLTCEACLESRPSLLAQGCEAHLCTSQNVDVINVAEPLLGSCKVLPALVGGNSCPPFLTNAYPKMSDDEICGSCLRVSLCLVPHSVAPATHVNNS